MNNDIDYSLYNNITYPSPFFELYIKYMYVDSSIYYKIWTFHDMTLLVWYIFLAGTFILQIYMIVHMYGVWRLWIIEWINIYMNKKKHIHKRLHLMPSYRSGIFRFITKNTLLQKGINRMQSQLCRATFHLLIFIKVKAVAVLCIFLW